MNRTFILILTVKCSTIELQKLIGDKRFELLKQLIVTKFTVQPFLPIKELSLMYNIHTFILYKFLKLKIIHPVQLPLHEPYFDLTLIRATHTKIPNKRIYKTYLFFLLVTKKANLLRMLLSACDEWLVPIQGLFTVTW